MTTTSLVLYSAVALVVGLLILLPAYTHRHPEKFPWYKLYSAHSLLLFASVAYIPMFAMVEMVGRYGISTLLAMIAFGLLSMLSPVALRPIQWFTNRHKISGITEILVYRFRGRRVGIAVTLTLLLTTLPLAVAMLRASSGTVALLTNNQFEILTAVFVLLLTIVFTSAVNASTSDTKPYGLPIIIAALAILAGLLAGMLAVVPEVFGSFQAMNIWEQQQQQFQTSLRFEYGPALVAIFFGASLAYPQFYTIRSFSRSEKIVAQSSWLFPLLLLLASLPMLPLLWSGIASRAEISLQLYASSLSSTLQLPVISSLTTTAGLLASTTGLILLSFSLSQPMTNYLAMPRKLDFTGRDFFLWIKKSNFLMLCLLTVLWLAAFLLIKTHSVTDLLLVSFSGLSQLTPAILATFYFPSISRRGLLCGLSAGILFWFFGLFIPLFIGSWSFDIPLLQNSLHLGLPYWSQVFYEAIFLNISLTVLVSLFSDMTEREQFFARECMVDNLPENYHLELQQHSIGDFEKGLSSVLGDKRAHQIISQLLDELDLDNDEVRPFQLRLFRQRIASALNALMGTDASSRLISILFPAISWHKINNNYASLKGILETTGSELSGLSSELNKLRLNYRNTVQSLPIGVCVLDEAQEISSWNSAMEQFTRISRNKAQGALIHQLPPPWNNIFSTFLASGKASEHAIEAHINNAQRWCTLHQSSIDAAKPSALNGQTLLLEDVTEIVGLSQGLIHAERLASVGRLAAGIAHEIGNPVTGIACLAQDIEADPEEQSVQDNARLILQQTQRITRIVRSLTDFSRSHSHHHISQTFDLTDSIADAVTLLELSNDKQVRFIRKVPEQIPFCGDKNQLTQVFVNLLTNARDVSQLGDSITINFEQTDEWVNIRVTDQGPGIPREKRDVIFEPFFTTKDIGMGTGLGLSIVYDIITLHKGSIIVEDNDQDNTLLIKLPRSD